MVTSNHFVVSAIVLQTFMFPQEFTGQPDSMREHDLFARFHFVSHAAI